MLCPFLFGSFVLFQFIPVGFRRLSGISVSFKLQCSVIEHIELHAVLVMLISRQLCQHKVVSVLLGGHFGLDAPLFEALLKQSGILKSKVICYITTM